MVIITDKSTRAMLIVKGNVQRVGYRVFVRQIANRMGIKGKVKNLNDGRVEVYCEGDNKELLLKFIEAIRIESKNHENVFKMHVDKIEDFWEGEECHEEEDGYKKLNQEMKRFEIDYGDIPIEKINSDRLEAGSLLMLNLNNDLSDGFSTTHSDFEELEKKYHTVSEKLGKLESIDNNLSVLSEHLGTIVEEFVKNKKNIKQ